MHDILYETFYNSFKWPDQSKILCINFVFGFMVKVRYFNITPHPSLRYCSQMNSIKIQFDLYVHSLLTFSQIFFKIRENVFRKTGHTIWLCVFDLVVMKIMFWASQRDYFYVDVDMFLFTKPSLHIMLKLEYSQI